MDGKKYFAHFMGNVSIINKTCIKRHNFEFYKINNDADVIQYTQLNRINLQGFIPRMNTNNSVTVKLIHHRVTVIRIWKRPRMIWWNNAEGDFQFVSIQNWRNLGCRRSIWRNALKKVRSHSGCSNGDDDNENYTSIKN